jgi:GNAT superfamily N-acetyltransferase
MLRIRTMTPADIPLGMRLKAQNGWNQLEADWQRLLAMEPDGCFVAETNGVGVGTACTCVFGSVAWIAMVLVDAERRKQGVGTALMEYALAYLDARGVRSVRLDATPLGRPIYEKLGFEAEYELARFEGALLPGPSLCAEPASAADLPELLALDLRVAGTDRGKLMNRLFAEQPDTFRVVRRERRLCGFVAARPGARAWQIGPCLGDADAGMRLMQDVSSRYSGKTVFLDVPLPNQTALDLAERMGLTVQRRLLRMGRGERVVERLDELWLSSGPEKG